MVLSQSHQVLHSESLPLCSQPSQVGICRYAVGRHLACLRPYPLSSCIISITCHPRQYTPQFIYIVRHRENLRTLQVRASRYIISLQPPFLQPLYGRTSHEQGRGIPHVPLELVLKSVRPCHIRFIAHRHNIYAHTFTKRQSPVIFRYARNYISARKPPFLAHEAVLYPYLRILLRQTYVYHRVLNESRRMRFHLMMHYRPLIHHTVLHRQRR